MAEIEKLDGKSMDIVEQNIEQLKALFPSVFSEGKIQFNQLEELLGNYVVEDEDHYSFTWHGKRKAGRLAQTPSTGTLRPCKKESVDWDNTENLFIEGDNLEVLKLLQKSYHRQVKMIYIDPPYNTGNEFIYPDKFQDNLDTYLKYTGQLDADGYKFSKNTENLGRYHTNWLNMIYPRIRLSKNLLRDDGVLFVSIGQSELSNLVALLDSIFGEENRISICTRLMKSGGQKGKFFSPNTDYVLVYAKNINSLTVFRGEISQELQDKVYNKVEDEGERIGERYRSMGLYQSSLDVRPNQRYFIECPDGSLAIPPGTTFPSSAVPLSKIKPVSDDGVWRWTPETYSKGLDLGNIIFLQTDQSPLVDQHGNRSIWNIYTKIWLKDRLEGGSLPLDMFDKFENRHSSKEISQIDIPFDYAKPTELLCYLMQIIGVENKDTVLDFFAGSASLAHAAMKYNALSSSQNVNYICVQLPEKIKENEVAYKKGFRNIADIGKERIRRAGKNIKDTNPDLEGDLGFRVFKLDSSNIKSWDADFDTLESDLVDAVDYLVEGRSDEDLLFELCLKLGLNLSVKIEENVVAGEKVFILGRGYLVVCLSDNITIDLVRGIGALKEELAPEDGMRIVFKDDGFKDDVVKTNALQSLKRFGIDDIKSL